jgi:hypothetical protein
MQIGSEGHSRLSGVKDDAAPKAGPAISASARRPRKPCPVTVALAVSIGSRRKRVIMGENQPSNG